MTDIIELYKQEIFELTDLVKNDEMWEDLREILIQKGFSLANMLLVSFIEDDNDMEFGVIVTKDRRVFEYTRSTKEDENNINHIEIVEVEITKNILIKCPQIQAALNMIDDGSL